MTEASRRYRPSAALRLLLGSAALAVLLVGHATAAEPALRAGDKVEMSVTGYPVLSRTAVVDASGLLSLPLFGDVAVAGRSMGEVRDELRGLVVGKTYQQQSPENGTTTFKTFEAVDLFLDLVERPPVYVNGDVSQPGERAYKPDMTVRQAVALSGGYDVMRLRKVDPFMESEDLRGEYRSLWATYAAQQARVWRLEAQLDGKDEMRSDMPEVPVDGALVEKVLVAEADILKSDASRLAEQRRFLSDGVERIDAQMATLSEQAAIQDKEILAAEKDAKSIEPLLKQGLVQAPRRTEVRQAITLARTLSFQTSVEMNRVETQRAALAKEISELDPTRRMETQGALRDARLELEKTKTLLDSVGSKLDYSSLLRSQLVRGSDGAPDVVIHRTEADGVRTDVAGDENTVLQPGDVVDVALGKDAGRAVPE